MGPSFRGDQVSIPASDLTNKYSAEWSNENSVKRSYSKGRGRFEEYEQLLQPIAQHNSAVKHKVQDLPSGRLESESNSLPRRKKYVKKKGETRGRDQNLQFLDGKQWVPAVYHHSIRAFLIEEASRNGHYTHPRERGLDSYDVTGFLESQKNWGPVRNENWAEILYVFQKPKNHKDPTYKLVEWKFHGKIVIAGHDNLPMLRFRDMPDTLSSALHGRDIEAMKRTDPRITHRDFIARMPMRHTTRAGTRMNIPAQTSIGTRMARFRHEQGMLSWITRHGSESILNALWERLPQENKMANSIRGLPQPTLAEQHEIKKGNAGKFMNRAGKFSLTSKERASRQKKGELRFRNRLQKEKGADEVFPPNGGDLDNGIKRSPKEM